MAPKRGRLPRIEGYSQIGDQVFMRPADISQTTSPTAPTSVMIFGWGDSLPKHVVKYADGFLGLFPAAQIVLIFTPILQSLTVTLEGRARIVTPAIEAVFGKPPPPPSPSTSESDSKSAVSRVDPRNKKNHRVLVLLMSNTGGISFAAALHAYQQAYGHPMPHLLAVLDSTPGSVDFLRNVGPYSKALSMGLTPMMPPWPTVFTRAIALVFFVVLHCVGVVTGAASSAAWSLEAVKDERLATREASRVYVYSRADELIAADFVEEQAAEARGKGYEVALEEFEGSGHVGHMRVEPDRYWGVILQRWEEAVERWERAAGIRL